MKNKKCPTVVTIPKSNPKIIETEGKFIPLTHIYIQNHSIPGLVQAIE